MKPTSLIKNLIRSIPGYEYLKNVNHGNGGETMNSRYCYSVWLRHLVHAYNNGLNSIPSNIAELGPGNSLGVGIAALISGSNKYFGLDVIKYQSTDINLKLFEELVILFKNRTPIPDQSEFPKLKPNLSSYKFPGKILPPSYMDKILNESRLIKIKKSIEAINQENSIEENAIRYIVPWNSNSIHNNNSIDMIISQASLCYVKDLNSTFATISEWLKPKGLMSHQIDFSSVGTSEDLQGHWEYSDLEWNLVNGRNNYNINRKPYSEYIHFIKQNNFKIISEIKEFAEKPIERIKLTKRFQNLPDEDLNIIGLFIQALKE